MDATQFSSYEETVNITGYSLDEGLVAYYPYKDDYDVTRIEVVSEKDSISLSPEAFRLLFVLEYSSIEFPNTKDIQPFILPNEDYKEFLVDGLTQLIVDGLAMRDPNCRGERYVLTDRAWNAEYQFTLKKKRVLN